MPFHMTCYPADKSYHETFHQVVRFLNVFNEKHEFLHFHWSRWEWMFARDNIKIEDLKQIKLFLDDQNEIKGLLTFEDEPGVWFLIFQDDLELKKEMVKYLIQDHPKDDIIIPKDLEMIHLLEKESYEKIDWTDPIAKFNLKSFEIPETKGYEIKSLTDDYKLDQIHYALWHGFNHLEEITYTKQDLEDRRHMTSSPNFKKSLTFVAHQDGHYVSYAGIWHLNHSKTALVEPVATVPKHRRKGLSKSCIYHAIKEALKDGAVDIFVGSTQKFYYDIGFIPYYEAFRYHPKD